MRDNGVQYVLGEFYDILKNLPDLDEELARGMREGKVVKGGSFGGVGCSDRCRSGDAARDRGRVQRLVRV